MTATIIPFNKAAVGIKQASAFTSPITQAYLTLTQSPFESEITKEFERQIRETGKVQSFGFDFSAD